MARKCDTTKHRKQTKKGRAKRRGKITMDSREPQKLIDKIAEVANVEVVEPEVLDELEARAQETPEAAKVVEEALALEPEELVFTPEEAKPISPARRAFQDV